MSSYKVIVADDEYDIRQGVSELLSDEIADIEIAGVFKTGKQVIDFISQNKVDLIVTDVCMPEADGLEVAKHIKENNIDTDVIIITAHRDFEYARKAVIYGVRGFETKPINFDSLIATVEKLRDIRFGKQIAKKEQINALKFLEDRAETSRKLKSYISGKLGYGEIKRIFTDLYEGIEKMPCAVVKFNIVGSSSLGEHQNTWRYMCEIDNEYYDSYCIDEDSRTADVFLLFKPSVAKKTEETATGFAEDTKSIIMKAYSAETEYTIEHFSNLQSITLNMIESSITLYIDYILDNNYSAINDMLQTIESIYDLDWYKTFVIGIIKGLKSNVDFESEEYEKAVEGTTEKEQLKEVLGTLNEKVFSDSKNKINQIKSYISRHYTEDISLVAVAQAFNFNPTYFSRFFKKECGEGYSDYIARFKIETAKELLVRSKKGIQEIAYILGYNGVGYFNKLFKSYTGYTLKQYRTMGGENK